MLPQLTVFSNQLRYAGQFYSSKMLEDELYYAVSIRPVGWDQGNNILQLLQCGIYSLCWVGPREQYTTAVTMWDLLSVLDGTKGTIYYSCYNMGYALCVGWDQGNKSV